MTVDQTIAAIRALDATDHQKAEFEKHLAWLQAKRSPDIVKVRLEAVLAAAQQGNWPEAQY